MSDTLRPAAWHEYIGQQKLKDALTVKMSAAQRANRPLEHILLTGPPGAGKTTLATLIAQEMHVPLEVLIMPVTETTLHNAVRQHSGVLFLDELHALGKTQEKLQPLLEFGYMTDNSGRKIHASRTTTVIGATTRPEHIIEPLWDRFYIPTFDDYDDDEMTEIVLGMANKAGMWGMERDIAAAFGRAACGTPRRARQFVLGYEELFSVNTWPPTAEEVLAYLRVEADGLTVNHIRYMEILKSLGGTKGIKIIASLMRLNEGVVQELERLLLVHNLIEYAERGRALTRQGYDRLNPNTENQAAA